MCNFIKKEKHSFFVSIVSFLIMLLICVSIFLPRNVGSLYSFTSEPIKTLTLSDVASQIDCTIDDSGKYTVTGIDPQIIFSLDDVETEGLTIEFDGPQNANTTIEVFTAFSDGAFSAERCYTGALLEGQDKTAIDLPKGKYSFVRIDINSNDVCLKGLKLYDEEPELVPYIPNYSVKDWVKGIAIPVFIAVIAWFVEKKIKFAEKVVCYFKENKIKISKFLIYIICAALVGILIELLVVVFAKDVSFNQYRAVFICGAMELITVLVYLRKNLAEKPENIFLPIALILGIVMLFGSPAKHISWDLDSHHPWAVSMSYIDTAYITAADYNIDIPFSQSEFSADFTAEKYEEDIQFLNNADKILVNQKQADFSIAHLPAGIFIAIARFFGAGFEFKYNFGRLAYLLVYVVVCYFAIRKIKSGKMILSVICLFPTNLFIATNYGYDYWVTAFTILGTSYFVSELQQPDKPISIKETLIMGISFALGALPKLVYIIMMPMTIFMRKNWQSKQQKRKYYLIIFGIAIAVFGFLLLRTMTTISGSGDARGGNVNPSAQLMGILTEPFRYAKVLFNFLKQYLAFGSTKEYISNFAYLGMGTHGIRIMTLLLLVSLTDTSDRVSFKVPLYMKGLAILLFFGMVAVIATALYIDFTPLYAETILGCSPRYIIPLLTPVLLLATGKRFNLFDNKALYNGVVLSYTTFLVMLEVYNVIIVRML